MRCVLFAAIFVLLFSATLLAEVFSWTDTRGTQHFTDDPATIPSKYRKQAAQSRRNDDSDAAPPAAKPSALSQKLSELTGRDQQGKADRLPKSLPPSDLELLATTLLEKATTDRDRAYAAFSWVHANIYYDNASKWQRRYGQEGGDQSPEGVLAAKRGVCAGMANLFAALANKMGLKSVVVTGRASGFRQEAHAWNAVMIDGSWGLVDLTRGSFLRPPQEFLAHHFPNDPQWQLLEKPLTYQEWLKL
jgi:transglutaminase/protease-like cytokinesis protein 3